MSGKILKDKLVKGERVYGTFFQHAVVPALVDFLPVGVLDFGAAVPAAAALPFSVTTTPIRSVTAGLPGRWAMTSRPQVPAESKDGCAIYVPRAPSPSP